MGTTLALGFMGYFFSPPNASSKPGANLVPAQLIPDSVTVALPVVPNVTSPPKVKDAEPAASVTKRESKAKDSEVDVNNNKVEDKQEQEAVNKAERKVDDKPPPEGVKGDGGIKITEEENIEPASDTKKE